jgi:hypothetical protein
VRAQDGARKIYQTITDKKAGDGDKKVDGEKKAEGEKKSIEGDRKPPDAPKKAPDHTGSISGYEETDPVLAESQPHDTLTQRDLALEWRLPSSP